MRRHYYYTSVLPSGNPRVALLTRTHMRTFLLTNKIMGNCFKRPAYAYCVSSVLSCMVYLWRCQCLNCDNRWIRCIWGIGGIIIVREKSKYRNKSYHCIIPQHIKWMIRIDENNVSCTCIFYSLLSRNLIMFLIFTEWRAYGKAKEAGFLLFPPVYFISQ